MKIERINPSSLPAPRGFSHAVVAEGRIVFLAGHAKFHREYSPAEVKRWLGVFLKRFFASQYKRSVLPDGPKVGTISLSPRGDWRMPSDATAAAWLNEVMSDE